MLSRVENKELPDHEKCIRFRIRAVDGGNAAAGAAGNPDADGPEG
jgi:hypothetical protein